MLFRADADEFTFPRKIIFTAHSLEKVDGSLKGRLRCGSNWEQKSWCRRRRHARRNARTVEMVMPHIQRNRNQTRQSPIRKRVCVLSSVIPRSSRGQRSPQSPLRRCAATARIFGPATAQNRRPIAIAPPLSGGKTRRSSRRVPGIVLISRKPSRVTLLKRSPRGFPKSMSSLIFESEGRKLPHIKRHAHSIHYSWQYHPPRLTLGGLSRIRIG
jgi:hypothetical protein